MASSLRSAHRDLAELDTCGGDPQIWCAVRGIRGGAADCSWKNGRRSGQEGMFVKCMVSIGMVLLLLQCALAVEDDSNYETSGFAASPQDPVTLAMPSDLLAGFMMVEEDSLSIVQSDGSSPSASTKEQPAFSSFLTLLASTARRPQNLLQPRLPPGSLGRNGSRTTQWLTDELIDRAEPSFTSSSSSSSSSSSILGPIGNYSFGSGLTSALSMRLSSMPPTQSEPTPHSITPFSDIFFVANEPVTQSHVSSLSPLKSLELSPSLPPLAKSQPSEAAARPSFPVSSTPAHDHLHQFVSLPQRLTLQTISHSSSDRSSDVRSEKPDTKTASTSLLLRSITSSQPAVVKTKARVNASVNTTPQRGITNELSVSSLYTVLVQSSPFYREKKRDNNYSPGEMNSKEPGNEKHESSEISTAMHNTPPTILMLSVDRSELHGSTSPKPLMGLFEHTGHPAFNSVPLFWPTVAGQTHSVNADGFTHSSSTTRVAHVQKTGSLLVTASLPVPFSSNAGLIQEEPKPSVTVKAPLTFSAQTSGVFCSSGTKPTAGPVKAVTPALNTLPHVQQSTGGQTHIKTYVEALFTYSSPNVEKGQAVNSQMTHPSVSEKNLYQNENADFVMLPNSYKGKPPLTAFHTTAVSTNRAGHSVVRMARSPSISSIIKSDMFRVGTVTEQSTLTASVESVPSPGYVMVPPGERIITDHPSSDISSINNNSDERGTIKEVLIPSPLRQTSLKTSSDTALSVTTVTERSTDTAPTVSVGDSVNSPLTSKSTLVSLGSPTAHSHLQASLSLPQGLTLPLLATKSHIPSEAKVPVGSLGTVSHLQTTDTAGGLASVSQSPGVSWGAVSLSVSVNLSPLTALLNSDSADTETADFRGMVLSSAEPLRSTSLTSSISKLPMHHFTEQGTTSNHDVFDAAKQADKSSNHTTPNPGQSRQPSWTRSYSEMIFHAAHSRESESSSLRDSTTVSVHYEADPSGRSSAKLPSLHATRPLPAATTEKSTHFSPFILPSSLTPSKAVQTFISHISSSSVDKWRQVRSADNAVEASPSMTVNTSQSGSSLVRPTYVTLLLHSSLTGEGRRKRSPLSVSPLLSSSAERHGDIINVMVSDMPEDAVRTKGYVFEGDPSTLTTNQALTYRSKVSASSSYTASEPHDTNTDATLATVPKPSSQQLSYENSVSSLINNSIHSRSVSVYSTALPELSKDTFTLKADHEYRGSEVMSPSVTDGQNTRVLPVRHMPALWSDSKLLFRTNNTNTAVQLGEKPEAVLSMLIVTQGNKPKSPLPAVRSAEARQTPSPAKHTFTSFEQSQRNGSNATPLQPKINTKMYIPDKSSPSDTVSPYVDMITQLRNATKWSSGTTSFSKSFATDLTAGFISERGAHQWSPAVLKSSSSVSVTSSPDHISSLPQASSKFTFTSNIKSSRAMPISSLLSSLSSAYFTSPSPVSLIVSSPPPPSSSLPSSLSSLPSSSSSSSAAPSPSPSPLPFSATPQSLQMQSMSISSSLLPPLTMMSSAAASQSLLSSASFLMLALLSTGLSPLKSSPATLLISSPLPPLSSPASTQLSLPLPPSSSPSPSLSSSPQSLLPSLSLPPLPSPSLSSSQSPQPSLSLPPLPSRSLSSSPQSPQPSLSLPSLTSSPQSPQPSLSLPPLPSRSLSSSPQSPQPSLSLPSLTSSPQSPLPSLSPPPQPSTSSSAAAATPTLSSLLSSSSSASPVPTLSPPSPSTAATPPSSSSPSPPSSSSSSSPLSPLPSLSTPPPSSSSVSSSAAASPPSSSSPSSSSAAAASLTSSSSSPSSSSSSPLSPLPSLSTPPPSSSSISSSSAAAAAAASPALLSSSLPSSASSLAFYPTLELSSEALNSTYPLVNISETHFLITEEPAVDDLLTSREAGAFSRENDSVAPPSQRKITDLPAPSFTMSSQTAPSATQKTLLQLITVTPTTVAPATTTTVATTTTLATTTTTTARPTTTEPTTTTTTTTTIAPPRTSAPVRPPARTLTIQPPRIFAPRMTTTVLTTTTTAGPPPLKCNITNQMLVKTVLSIHLRRSRLDSVLKQNLPRGLSQALRKALNDSALHVQIETLSTVPNVTVGYYVLRGDMVYTPAAVVEALSGYGVERLMADVRQFVPLVQAVPIPALPWRQSPAISLLLKTVLRFVNADDDLRSCRFTQMMEQRLEKAFAETEAKVLHSHSGLSVQILSASQSAGSPAVSLVYVVRNGSVPLNGTVASSLLSQLTAELLGYFLFYPPLITAEPLEYHNLNTSAATRDFWVITVIQDVDNSSLEGQYQSFASLMEQRLAELFVVAHQQGGRFRRAATAGSYTVQMVSMRRVAGPKNPAELTYYVQMNAVPLAGTSAAKVLNTVDSQTMALTLGYFVQLQAEPVVKNPPNNLWIIAAVLAPIGVVTVIIIIITAVLCRKNKSDFKTDSIGNLNPRAKSAYRRDAGYYIQPVQGFDYAKQHLGQQGGDEETLPVTQETKVLPLPIRDAPLSLEKVIHPDGTSTKKTLSSEIRKSRLPSEDGSVISNESVKLHSGRGSTVPKVPTQQKMTKEETRKRNDPYDTSSGSLQLISIKPMAAPPTYSHPASSDRSQDSAILNGEVSLALKQKSDIEHYRNKLRLKAKRKGYYDLPLAEGNSGSSVVSQRYQHSHQRAPHEQGRPLENDDDRSSTYVKSHRRQSQVRHPAYRSRQSLNSPSPGGTEMDLLVMRERPRKGIRNSGYDTEPEIIEETNVDRLMSNRSYGYGRQVKGHSETSTLSSQPSIDEVRQQMHLLLEEAFSLASAGHSSSAGRHHHHPLPQHPHHHLGPYNPGPPIPYSEVVTSAPGTMNRNQRALQWVPAYGPDLYQCSLPKPAFRFTQLPDMAVGSPPPPIPPRTGPPGTSLRRSSSDLGPKVRSVESSVTDVPSQHDSAPYVPVSRAALPSVTTDQPLPLNHSGNPISAVYAIPATRPGYPGYFLSTPPSSYHSPSWMSYPPEPEDVPPQWAESVPLPGYAEAFPHPRYPQGSPLLQHYGQPPSALGGLDRPTSASTAASQQSLADPLDLPVSVNPLTNLSTSALVKAIREEVAKLAKKQTDMFEFQV